MGWSDGDRHAEKGDLRPARCTVGRASAPGTTNHDLIIDEVRAIRESIAQECDNDIHPARGDHERHAGGSPTRCGRE